MKRDGIGVGYPSMPRPKAESQERVWGSFFLCSLPQISLHLPPYPGVLSPPPTCPQHRSNAPCPPPPYLVENSRLGTLCQRFLSTHTSRTDTAEAAVMTCSSAALPHLDRLAVSHTRQNLASAPLVYCPLRATVQLRIRRLDVLKLWGRNRQSQSEIRAEIPWRRLAD